MCGRQRKRVQHRGICGLAKSIARAHQDVAHGVADARIELGRNEDLNDLLHQVTLCRFRHQLDQRVATIAHDGNGFLHLLWRCVGQ